ncbi:hypothetical protein SFC65_24200 [Priestia filamentosa]|uniref:hypothetical protein n=1 Tax=Priestia filamentosa TaxID=1402861 RepID=UPI0039828D9E
MDIKIGFSGKMTAGKTTISNELAKKYGYIVMPIGNQIKTVANLLIENKSLLMDYLLHYGPAEENVSVQAFTQLDRLFSLTFQPLLHKNSVENIFKKDPKTGVYLKNKYYRDLTQKVGTSVRNVLGEQIWIDLFLKQAEEMAEKGHKVICDDVRLEIEYKRLSEVGYKLIRLDVEEDVQKQRIIDLYGSLDEAALYHHTETALDGYHFEHRLNTSRESIETTVKRIEKFII